MLTIRCIRCRRKIFRYHKIGKGRVLHCWKNRIKADHSMRKGDQVLCTCGNVIGRDEPRWVKMRQASFFYTGKKD